MQKLKLLSFFLLFWLVTSSQTTQLFFKDGKNPYPFAISKPDDPSITDAIILLHGIGGVGTTGTSDIGLMYVLSSDLPAQMAPLAKQFILCIPKLPAGRWDDNNYAVIQNAYDTLMSRYKPSRVFIVGNSWGGQGATGYPASSAARKAAIAASINISGCRPNSSTLSTLKDFPIYFIHDVGDQVVRIAEAEGTYAMIGGMQQLQPFDKVNGYGHGYLPNWVSTQQKYWDWLRAQGKASPPAPVKSIIARLLINGMEVIVYSDKTAEVK